jgi:hypothetical protein
MSEKSVTQNKSNYYSATTIVLSESVDKLITELDKLQVTVKCPYTQLKKNDLLKLAVFMGENYPTLASIYEKMKANINESKKSKFIFSLSESCKHNYICIRFREILENQGLWNSRYIESEKIICFQAHCKDFRIKSFFQGGWLEIFVVHKICSLLSYHKIEYNYLINPQIIYSRITKSKSYELDALFLINDKLFLVEVKTGDKRNICLNQLTQHITERCLCLPKERAFLIMLSLSNVETEDWNRKNHNITVLNLNNFIKCISTALELPES